MTNDLKDGRERRSISTYWVKGHSVFQSNRFLYLSEAPYPLDSASIVVTHRLDGTVIEVRRAITFSIQVSITPVIKKHK